MTRVPMSGFNPMPNPGSSPISQAYISMGETAENLARKYKIARERAGAARRRQPAQAPPRREAAGKLTDEIVPITAGNQRVEKDGCIRPGTDAEDPGGAEARLRRGRHGDRRHLLAADRRRVGGPGRDRGLRQGPRPAAARADPQHRGRRLRAGDHGHRPGARRRSKALKRAGLALKDIDIIELNEAFAVQALACIDELGIDWAKINLDGGAIALGHPLGATGARITGKAAATPEARGQGNYALATQCIGGGQGIATILEAV